MKYNKIMENYVLIGKAIREKRLALNLRMEDVAKAADITRSTLWSIEKGNGNCSFISLLRVLDVLGLSIFINEPKKIESNRNRATRINTKDDKKINRFIVMCVEQYASRENKQSAETYKEILDKGIIDELTNDYEDLHGMSTEYLNDYIDSLLR